MRGRVDLLLKALPRAGRMSFFAPFKLLERDRILSWCGYPAAREGLDAIFSSDASIERGVIGGWGPSLVHTRFSYLCLTLGADHVVPLPCFVLAHTDVIDLACAAQRVLVRLGVARDSRIRSLVQYDPRASTAVALVDAGQCTHARAYDRFVCSDANTHMLTCLVADLDVSWEGLVKHRLSRARALERIRATAERRKAAEDRRGTAEDRRGTADGPRI